MTTTENEIHDAVLSVVLLPVVGTSMFGTITADKAGRFADGTPIITSQVQNLFELDESLYAKTRNTTYKVHSKIAP